MRKTMKGHKLKHRILSAALAAITVVSASGSTIAPAAATPHPMAREFAKRFATPMTNAMVRTIALPDGRTADIYDTGLAAIHELNGTDTSYQLIHIPAADYTFRQSVSQMSTADLQEQLEKGKPLRYAAGRVLVVLKPGVTTSNDVVVAHAGAATLSFTNDSTLNATLTSLGAVSAERLFRGIPRSTLSMMHSRGTLVSRQATAQALDFSNAYKIQITRTSVANAVQKLLKSPSVAFAEPDWLVSTMNVGGRKFKANDILTAQQRSESLRMRSLVTRMQAVSAGAIPSNYAVQSSFQPMLNAPGVNAVAAFDEIAKAFPSTLPGSGAIVTNVSIGDVDDATTAAPTTNPCHQDVTDFGPTATLVGGQHYIDWPGLPLIPAYVIDSNGNPDGATEVCGNDAFLDEIGMDFSVMAPLPHNLERPGRVATGAYDLLGIAPGASYRLVAAGVQNPATSDIDAALLGAAMQQPRPDVITASIGIGADSFGFPSRYMEDDPLASSVVAGIVNAYGIVVCISANDGTRLSTPVAIGPAGGSVATNLADATHPQTNANDVELSTAPSYDVDSGAIDVGGVTVDDIFAANPQDPNNAALASQHAFAETRWTGVSSFSSGFGQRVNIAAPADGIAALYHAYGGPGVATAVGLSSNGGTSASAPEVAAAAAVVIALARKLGHPFATPLAVRQFLIQTGTALPNVPQADQNLNVGPQVNLARAVETLFAEYGTPLKPGVPRVAIEQRRQSDGLDMQIETDTDPGNIDLAGPTDYLDEATGINSNAYITMAPDWEAMPAHATYSLSVVGSSTKVLATTPWARLLPAQILSAAGMQLVSTGTRTVALEYKAMSGIHLVASARFTLTFGPCTGTVIGGLAPIVPAVVTGSSIPVTYDLTKARIVSNPALVISMPGHTNPETGPIFHPLIAPLGQMRGTVNVPVAALQGGGIYGIGIITGARSDGSPILTDFAYTRVTTQSARPAAPLLTYQNYMGHSIDVPLNATVQLQYDVTNVPNATGAILEISAPGPGLYGIYNPFNNPDGTIQDDNGIDSGSVYYQPLPGTSGTVSLNLATAGLTPSFIHDVRVLPTRGGVVNGEAGDSSTIQENPIADPSMLGDASLDGFSINTAPGATVGMMTPRTSAGAAVELFNQTTGVVTSTLLNQSSGSSPYPYLFWEYGPSYAAGTYSVVGVQSTGATIPSFYIENNYTTGNVASASQISPPIPTTSNGLSIAADWTGGAAHGKAPMIQRYNLDPGSNLGYFVGIDWSGIGMLVWTQTINAAATFSNYIDLWPVVKKIPSNTPLGTSGPYETSNGEPNFDVNRSTNRAYVGVTPSSGQPAAPSIAIANFGTSSASLFSPPAAQIGVGIMDSIAIDSTTNVMMVSTEGWLGTPPMLSFWNISNAVPTFIASVVTDGGLDWGRHLVADPVNHRFFVMQEVPGDASINNNAMSTVLEYNESGTLVNRFEQFNYMNIDIRDYAQYLNVNGNLKRGFTMGTYDGEGVAPFNYTP